MHMHTNIKPIPKALPRLASVLINSTTSNIGLHGRSDCGNRDRKENRMPLASVSMVPWYLGEQVKPFTETKAASTDSVSVIRHLI